MRESLGNCQVKIYIKKCKKHPKTVTLSIDGKWTLLKWFGLHCTMIQELNFVDIREYCRYWRVNPSI